MNLGIYFERRREMAALAVATFERGENVVNTLLTRFPDAKQEAIELAYELQAGSYTASRDMDISLSYRREQHDILLKEVMPRCNAQEGASLLDAGTGEGTGWYKFDFAASPVTTLHAVDISLNRLSCVAENVTSPPALLVPVRADLRDMPYQSRSFDIVVTMHAIEPNGGNEREIIASLADISTDLLCLFEPDYEAASAEGKARMERLGYALRIFEAVKTLPDFELLFYRPLKATPNPLNPTSVICLKRKTESRALLRRRSPLSGLDLIHKGDHLAETGKGASAVFPVISGVECLRRSDAVMKIIR